MKGRLNLFQRAMLRWRELYPYSAVHAVLVEMPLDADKLTATIDIERARQGLTGFVLDAKAGRYEYHAVAANSHVDVVTSVEAERALDEEIERQLNTRFPDTGAYDPFRFFAIAQGDSFFLGIAYDHIVASGDCIVVLLCALSARYRGQPVAASTPLLYPPSYARLFRRNKRAVLRGVRDLPALMRSCRRSVRPRLKDALDGRNGYVRHCLSSADYQALQRGAKGNGVTLNDLLLALLLHALDRVTADRRRARRRREIGVASIMNLRSEFGFGASEVFGQFLGSMRLSHPVPAGIGVPQLAREVSLQTRRIKRDKLFLQNLVALPVNALIWRFQTPAQRSRFYQKGYPVWAGISILNVGELWRSGKPDDPPPLYVRGVSTGPVAPLVMSVSTSGDRLQAGLSYRTTAFAPADVAELWTGVLDGLRTLQ